MDRSLTQRIATDEHVTDVAVFAQAVNIVSKALLQQAQKHPEDSAHIRQVFKRVQTLLGELLTTPV
jgi:hypothetical protein